MGFHSTTQSLNQEGSQDAAFDRRLVSKLPGRKLFVAIKTSFLALDSSSFCSMTLVGIEKHTEMQDHVNVAHAIGPS